MTVHHDIAERQVERIEAQVDELVRVIAAASDEAWARRHGDQWSAAEVCGHVAEMLPFWAAQAREIAADPGRRVGREEDDPRRVGGVRQGASLDRHQTVEHLRAAAAEASAIIRALPDAAWTTEAVSESLGRTTVERMVDALLIQHLEDHVQQVERGVG
ncbi:MAG: DinB family protein [Chloroflexi bacterium]|nr:DinB family protein [Chloroflexota bacterium]